MPTPPGDLSYYTKVNYVIDAWARPCEAPWYIYVQALKPAALTAFITLATFGWDDVARGYFRPRGLGLRRTSKRKGKWRKAIPAFPELGEEIGKRLPGADEVKGTKWGVLGNALWRIDTQIQQGLFWWLVADVTIDFAYNFTSVLYESRWCQASSLGRFSYRSDTLGIIAGGAPRAIPYDIREYQFAPPFWTVIFGESGINGCTAFGTVDFEPLAGNPHPTAYNISLRHTVTGEIYGKSGPFAPGVDGKAKMAVKGNVPPFTRFSIVAEHNAPFALFGKGIVTAMEAE